MSKQMYLNLKFVIIYTLKTKQYIGINNISNICIWMS